MIAIPYNDKFFDLNFLISYHTDFFIEIQAKAHTTTMIDQNFDQECTHNLKNANTYN